MPSRTAVLVIGGLSSLTIYLVQERTFYDDWSKILLCFRLRRQKPAFDRRGLCTNHHLELSSSLIERGGLLDGTVQHIVSRKNRALKNCEYSADLKSVARPHTALVLYIYWPRVAVL